MSPARRESWSKWLPFITSAALQVLGCTWYASHENAMVEQNAKDIAEVKAVLVPRPEIESVQRAVQVQLSGMDAKLNILLERSSSK